MNKGSQCPLKKYVLGAGRDRRETFGICTESGKKKKEKATAESGLVIKNCFNKMQPCLLLVENPQPSWENNSNQLQRNIIC